MIWIWDWFGHWIIAIVRGCGCGGGGECIADGRAECV